MILKSGETFRPDPAMVINWRTAYPAIDVDQELRKMAVWLEANPTRRKTARGMNRFIVNWLNRAKPQPHNSTRARSLAQDLTDRSWSKGMKV